MKLKNLLAKERIVSPSRDVIAGLVVAFAMIPEAIAFSGIAGVDPRVGLFGAFLLSVTLAIFGGLYMGYELLKDLRNTSQ